MSSSLESLAVKSSRVSSHSAKFESSRESPKKVTRVRLESLPVTRVNNSGILAKMCRPLPAAAARPATAQPSPQAQARVRLSQSHSVE